MSGRTKVGSWVALQRSLSSAPWQRRSCVGRGVDGESKPGRCRQPTRLLRLFSVGAALTLGVGGVSAISLGSVSGASVGRKGPGPTVASFVDTPSDLSSSGGSVVLSASVTNAVNCVFSSKPAIAGLPATIPCSNGSVTEDVTIPANNGTKATRYVFRLSVQGTVKVKKAKAVRLTVAKPEPVSLVTDGVGYCAVVTSGGVDCWGDNTYGELGDGSELECSSSETCSTKPVAVSDLSGVTNLSSDRSSYCAVLHSGGVDCWGDNYYGELGDGTTSGPETCNYGGPTVPCSRTPVTVDGLTDVSSLTTEGNGYPNGFGYCAVLTSGGVDCWGENSMGELGNGTTTESDVPVPVTGLTGVTSIASDGDGDGDLYGYCATLSSGGVDCWGDNSVGELGDGTSTGPDTCSGSACSTVPVAVAGLSGAATVVSDSEGYCAALTSGGVDCWGANGSGQLGNGTTADSDVPVAVTGIGSPVTLASDGDGMCALGSGIVDCWGDNSVGELGDGFSTGPDSCSGGACGTTPGEVTGLASPSSLGSDDGGYCAIVASGGVDCWGDNELGFLGIGSATGPDSCGNLSCSTTPVGVGLTGEASITSDGSGYCVLGTSGGVACWGTNMDGQLGDGTTSDSDSPQYLS
jgi:alpha-tubulin suppressor-like RCC1 family protein